MRLASVLLLFTTALAFADDDAGKKEQEKFQGTWKITSIENEGEKYSGDAIGENIVIIMNDKYEQKVNGRQVEVGTMRLDPSKTPKTLDFVIKEGDAKGKTQLGIYEVSGDTWKVCLAPPGNEKRPTEFAAKKGTTSTLFTLEKQKK